MFFRKYLGIKYNCFVKFVILTDFVFYNKLLTGCFNFLIFYKEESDETK